MRRALVIAAALVTTVLGGCSSASKKYTAIPAKGQTPAQLAIDMDVCERSAQGYKDDSAAGAAFATGGPATVTTRNAYERKYVECMTTRGYTFKE
jgi:outer membrane murein-binding lipoprotein Lpp